MPSPTHNDTFIWPAWDEIAACQRRRLNDDDAPSGIVFDDERRCYATAAQRIWIPDDEVDLQQRLLVIAHAGHGGHRRQDATFTTLEAVFTWSAMKEDVKVFVNQCLHCLRVDGFMEPRPWGSALHATYKRYTFHNI